jgi:methylphosphotriester-DNA--protein-cysteine methyltransferase
MKRIILAVFLLLSLAISLDIAPAINVGTEHSAWVADQSTSTDHNSLGTCDYIGNSNTHKFHVPGCSWVPKINPEHKVCFSSASSAIAAGYDACKKCHPA